ncbi:MAG: Gfo/Idh/MocA family oxidoreductase [Fimbriimonadales bacterium]|nr:Gfo/Idh/MocA family oxidoreductase [Fimbriimonadales bacterium]MDW8051151.1 Gfo/Idh/MocA family oxidoreductase [Armatimonadota bacterium]
MQGEPVHLAMNGVISRREFLRQSASAGAGLLLLKSWGKGQSPNDKLNIAVIGVGGRGWDNLQAVAKTENIVALCDVDLNMLARAAREFPNARLWVDYRRMFDRQKDIDAVVISTPDHTHALPTMLALLHGKHVYCEKPLVHSPWEARQVREAARKAKVATQMGNQHHASEPLRMAVEVLRSGAIGTVREVHAWSDRPIWPQGIARPTGEKPVPPHLFWDAWLGPAPYRPYHDGYHPFNWRGWWDFGTGALGDMGCHIIDPAYWALDLGLPTSVEMEGEPRMPESGPKSSRAIFEFPARGNRPPVKLYWYDGGLKPDPALIGEKSLAPNGIICIGDKGALYFIHPYQYRLYPKERFEGFTLKERTLPVSPGHHEEWLRACKTGSPTYSNFEYATMLTEAVLLGNAAFRAGEKIYWDAKEGRVTNTRKADEYIRRPYRKGWEWW